MNCEIIKEFIAEYIDGQLDADATSLVEKHLSSCENCRIEVEQMQLDGYAPFDKEIVEEWGVQTNGTGKASYTFNEPSGNYDIRITYFDEKQGNSRVTLIIAGRQRAVPGYPQDDLSRGLQRAYRRLQDSLLPQPRQGIEGPRPGTG